MGKMWAGRFTKELNKLADDFNSSIPFDCKMYKSDITGSIAHAKMLGKQGIITVEDSELIVKTLNEILDDLNSGALAIDMECEDIHMFVEQVLTERIGDVGKRLHTARSRNDQVAVDIRLHLRSECDEIIGLLSDVIEAVVDKAALHASTIMPGYTHLQRAQPITFGHQLLAYTQMFMRDIGRIQDAKARMNYSPLGSCALAGTTYDTDRYFTADALGFSGICMNSIDGVSDRDFALELMSAFSITMMHLSRFCEELIMWSSLEFHYIEFDDSYTTGSSIMPQKKNPDIAELIRGKTGRVYGDLVALLTTMKALPLAYNKDMQEDKEAIFDCVDTVKMCLMNFAPLIATMRVYEDSMLNAAKTGFINATDLADYMVKKGLPFRAAYKIVGQIVARCIADSYVLDNLPLEIYKEYDPVFEEDLYEEISLETCVKKRISAGGTGFDSVNAQIAMVKEFLNKLKER